VLVEHQVYSIFLYPASKYKLYHNYNHLVA
jgi:hypothetical protein